MHAGEHHGFQEGPLPGRVGFVRGVTVIAIAIAIGSFLLIRVIDDRGDGVIAASDGATAGELSGEGFVNDDDAGAPADGSATTGEGPLGSAPASPLGGPVIGGDDAGAGVTPDGDDPLEEGAPHDGGPGDGTSQDVMVDGGTADTAPAGPSAPEAVTVLVLNAALEKGVAGRGTELLDSAGYTVMPPRNADALGPSAVLYTAGHEADAIAVAGALNVDPGEVVGELDPMSPPMNDYGAADVIVVVGNDGVIDVSGV